MTGGTAIENKDVLDVINSLEVEEYGTADSPYMLVENNEENRSKMQAVGVSEQTLLKYGDDEFFCIVALSYSEGYANSHDGTNFIYDPASTD